MAFRFYFLIRQCQGPMNFEYSMIDSLIIDLPAQKLVLFDLGSMEKDSHHQTQYRGRQRRKPFATAIKIIPVGR
jgi:hypothetical protein